MIHLLNLVKLIHSGHRRHKSAENLEKALIDCIGPPTKSPTKRDSHKPPQKVSFTPLEDAARMVAERQKAKKWEPGPNALASVQKRHVEALLKI